MKALVSFLLLLLPVQAVCGPIVSEAPPTACVRSLHSLFQKWVSPEERQLIEDLKNDEIVSVEHPQVRHTNESPLILVLSSGKKIVFKFNEVATRSSGMNKEIAAFLFDRMLGLHLVPATFVRREATFRGSAQLFIEGFHKTESLYKTTELEIFDFLIHTMDRTPENAIWTKEGKLHAIDHGYSLNPVQTPISSTPVHQERLLQKAQRCPRLMERMRKLPDFEIQELLQPLVGREATEQVILRKNWLLQNLPPKP